MLLDVFGLVPNAASQTSTALYGLQLAMSWIPAAVALLMAFVVFCYPLGRKKVSSAASVAALIVFAICAAPAAQAEDAIKFANFGRYAGANLKAIRKSLVAA